MMPHDILELVRNKFSFSAIPAPLVTVNRRNQVSLPSIPALFSENRTTLSAELSAHMSPLTDKTFSRIRRKNFICLYILTCEYKKTFSAKIQLQSYLKLVHRSKPKHQCPFCRAKFVRMNDKKFHENAVQKNIRQFQCSPCRSSSTNKFSLNRHIKAFHSYHNF